MKKICITLTIIVTFILATHNIHGDEPEMVLISAGEFNIGESTTTVHLKDYYIDKTEITQKRI
jgi:formylglycine-generating enzyme required for sulfatase activity